MANTTNVAALKMASGSWNESLVLDSFLLDDVGLILNIPCSPLHHRDSLTWHYDRLGFYTALYSPKVAEAIAILQGLQFTIEVCLVPYVIESDALSMIKLIKEGEFPCYEVGIIVKDICLTLDSLASCLVDFTPRIANKAAHALAKLGLSLVDIGY
ncbi:hypothetical protein Dsin_009497 [Dipteronia sinensis]|uniref:RNase H type-1 domain-containing protein n=1 Tax=Dipteronia sinensis TaxID=43782 RepID=A0AAE0EC61_9ROSI|nr:hypothetical protein Dsin_009497 [Dipteronia sinensis]